jgi:hypothetical protein
MTTFTPDATDDAARDALALVRAALRGDDEAAAAVAANLSWPGVTAALLAQWLAGTMAGLGAGEDAIDAWQAQAGLK